MIRRLYVHNFRCLENFELSLAGHSSALLIGKNGSGKSTVGLALRILQAIGRGTNRVGSLVGEKDFARGRTDVPMRFEIEVELESGVYGYTIAFELPPGFREPRVFEEKLTVNGNPIYTRESAQVHLAVGRGTKETGFPIDWHLAALPVIQQPRGKDVLSSFSRWLARMLILRPIPGLIQGDSRGETLEPDLDVLNYGAWWSGVLAEAPSAYGRMDEYLKQMMPDLLDIRNQKLGADARTMTVWFGNEQGSFELPLGELSDGEKCFMVCALVLAANHAFGPLFCFWDEPDSHLAPSEVGQFVMSLRRAFIPGGQFLATSHHPEAIRRFSDENTFLLYRNSHLEPTIIRPLHELDVKGGLVDALIRGDVEP